MAWLLGEQAGGRVGFTVRGERVVGPDTRGGGRDHRGAAPAAAARPGAGRRRRGDHRRVPRAASGRGHRRGLPARRTGDAPAGAAAGGGVRDDGRRRAGRGCWATPRWSRRRASPTRWRWCGRRPPRPVRPAARDAGGSGAADACGRRWCAGRWPSVTGTCCASCPASARSPGWPASSPAWTRRCSRCTGAPRRPCRTRCWPGRRRGRRVVLATSVAESRLTVPGVRVVVDCGPRQGAAHRPRAGAGRADDGTGVAGGGAPARGPGRA